VEYNVIIVNNPERLVRLVNQAISEGWLPQGGITNNGYGSWAQAMVKDAVLEDKK
jgi:hypothetical protein